MLRFDRFMCRRYQGHPSYSRVDMFYKREGGGEKVIYTQSFKRDFSTVPANVLVTSANPNITKNIAEELGCLVEDTWLTVPKHISGVMRIDMVLLMNCYCDMRSRECIWELQYYTPNAMPASVFRQDLQLQEIWGEATPEEPG